ncbi:hypothetical protein [Nocardiopsis gilva]|uniref:hypothetical protein n=1 Tax=Nocardiopsis gilva TaxID=280236 RepID=UPI0012FDBFDE|nr:hypothetical protein [Nocardiopsis gilva]
MSEVEEKKRIDLNMSQVVGGGIATLGAASAASYLGVWGTIGGAAAMSVMSTVGGAVIQHFVKQSGDKAKKLAERTQVAPAGRQRVTSARAADGGTAVAGDAPVSYGADATQAMLAAGAGTRPPRFRCPAWPTPRRPGRCPLSRTPPPGGEARSGRRGGRRGRRGRADLVAAVACRRPPAAVVFVLVMG